MDGIFFCSGLCDIDDVLSLQANERVAKTIELVSTTSYSSTVSLSL